MKISAPVKYGCLVPVAILSALIIGGCIYDRVAPSAARKALPPSATEIQEFYRGAGFDFIRCLKAKLPQSDFEAYAKSLSLTKSYTAGQDTSDFVTMNITGHFPEWFDPPGVDRASAVKYESGGAWVSVLQYHEPYVYFFVFDW